MIKIPKQIAQTMAGITNSTIAIINKIINVVSIISSPVVLN